MVEAALIIVSGAVGLGVLIGRAIARRHAARMLIALVAAGELDGDALTDPDRLTHVAAAYATRPWR